MRLSVPGVVKHSMEPMRLIISGVKAGMTSFVQEMAMILWKVVVVTMRWMVVQVMISLSRMPEMATIGFKEVKVMTP